LDLEYLVQPGQVFSLGGPCTFCMGMPNTGREMRSASIDHLSRHLAPWSACPFPCYPVSSDRLGLSITDISTPGESSTSRTTMPCHFCNSQPLLLQALWHSHLSGHTFLALSVPSMLCFPCPAVTDAAQFLVDNAACPASPLAPHPFSFPPQDQRPQLDQSVFTGGPGKPSRPVQITAAKSLRYRYTFIRQQFLTRETSEVV